MTHQEAALKLRSAVRDIMLVSEAFNDSLFDVEWEDLIKGLAYAQIKLEVLDYEGTGSWPDDPPTPRKVKKAVKVSNDDVDDDC